MPYLTPQEGHPNWVIPIEIAPNWSTAPNWLTTSGSTQVVHAIWASKGGRHNWVTQIVITPNESPQSKWITQVFHLNWDHQNGSCLGMKHFRKHNIGRAPGPTASRWRGVVFRPERATQRVFFLTTLTVIFNCNFTQERYG